MASLRKTLASINLNFFNAVTIKLGVGNVVKIASGFSLLINLNNLIIEKKVLDEFKYSISKFSEMCSSSLSSNFFAITNLTSKSKLSDKCWETLEREISAPPKPIVGRKINNLFNCFYPFFYCFFIIQKIINFIF